MSLPRDFDSLSPMEKRAAVTQATGMSWEEYSRLPGELKTQILLTLKGRTYQSGTLDMLGASKFDAMANRLGGFVSGMSTGMKLTSVVVLVGIVWLMLPTLKSAPAKIRKAVA
jgi:hypothetical protein